MGASGELVSNSSNTLHRCGFSMDCLGYNNKEKKMIEMPMTFQKVEKYRMLDWQERPHKTGDTYGFFSIPSDYDNKLMFIMAVEDGEGWDHVSVSRRDGRALRWKEMCQVKDLFWHEESTVVQYHPPKSKYINYQEVLHLWRPRRETLPVPPINFV